MIIAIMMMREEARVIMSAGNNVRIYIMVHMVKVMVIDMVVRVVMVITILAMVI